MKKRKKQLSTKEKARRKNQSEFCQGVIYLSDGNSGAIKAIPIKGGYRLF